MQLCFGAASCNDPLLARGCLQGTAAEQYPRLRLNGFLVSLQPAQSKSEDVVTSSTILSYLHICSRCLSRFKNI